MTFFLEVKLGDFFFVATAISEVTNIYQRLLILLIYVQFNSGFKPGGQPPYKKDAGSFWMIQGS